MEDLKPIDTASIPVIKAKINLKVFRARESGEPLSDSEATEQDMLPIDITFDDSPPQPTAASAGSPPHNQDFNFKFGLNQFPAPFGAQQTANNNNFGFDGFANFQFGF